MASTARRTRPPSIRNAGMRLNRTRKIFTEASFEFMEQHAQKQRHDEHDALHGRVAAAVAIVGETNPRQKNQERDVDLQIDAGNAGDADGPFHMWNLSFSWIVG